MTALGAARGPAGPGGTTPGKQVLTGPFWVIYRPADAATSPVVMGDPHKPPTLPGYVVDGPYQTFAEAQAKADSIRKGVQIPALANPLGYLGEIGHFFGLLVSHLTDVHMWISLAWLALGIVLFIEGLLLLLKVPQAVAGIAGKIL